MKKNLLLCCFIASGIFLGSGCVSVPTATTVFGAKCRALSESELANLIAYTRGSLKKNAKKYNFSPEEMRIIRKDQPMIFVEYRGDCFGTLMIYWKTPTRRLGLRFENDFLAEFPTCAMIIGTNNGGHLGVKPDKSRRGR